MCGTNTVTAIPQTATHGSLEGVGGLKTNEAYHSKADALVIPEIYAARKGVWGRPDPII